MQKISRKRVGRSFFLRFNKGLTSAIETELERRGMRYTAWFEELLMEVGLSYSRQKKSIEELVESWEETAKK